MLGARGSAAVLAAAMLLSALGALAPAAAQSQGRTQPLERTQPQANPYPRVVTTDCQDGPPGRRVLVVGDSITVFTRPTLERVLGSVGWSVCIDARRTETTRGALDHFAADGAFPAYVDVVVMATGTNDWVDPAAFVGQVARARALAEGRPLLWITTWVHPTAFSARDAAAALASARRVNSVIRRLVDRARPGSVVDWYAAVAAGPSRPRAFLRDGVHTTDLGARQRSTLLATALGRLLR